MGASSSRGRGKRTRTRRPFPQATPEEQLALLRRSTQPLPWEGGREVMLSDANHAPGASYAASGVPAYVHTDAEGGRWILLLAYSHRGGTNPKLVPATLPLSPYGLCHTTVQQLGADVGRKVAVEDIAEVRFYAHTSAHTRVIHFKSSHPGVRRMALDGHRAGRTAEWFAGEGTTMLEGHTAHTPGSCHDMAANNPRGGGFTELPFYHPGRFHWNVRGSGKRWEVDDYAKGSKHTTLHQVWVRMQDSVFAIDGDPGDYVAAKPQRRAPPDALRVVKQPSVDAMTIEHMAKPELVPGELQRLLLSEQPQENICFHCEGTGKRAVALRNVYGAAAAQSVLDREGWVVMDLRDPTGGEEEEGGEGGGVAGVAEAEAGAVGLGVGAGGGGGGGTDPAAAAPDASRRRRRSTWACAQCSEVNPSACSACSLCATPREWGRDRDHAGCGAGGAPATEAERGRASSLVALGEPAAPLEHAATPVSGSRRSVAKPRPGSHRLDECWVCRGTGTTSAMLGAFEYRGHAGTEDETKGKVEEGGAGGEAGGSDGEDEDECEICWAEAPKYGISAECTHFYCEGCIQEYLNTVLREGTAPAFCPGCQENAPEGSTPSAGRVEGKALTFLQRRGVITKQMQFRLMRLFREAEVDEQFFQCPAKCGNFLVDKEVEVVMRLKDVGVKVERCPCGAAVCVSCHQLVPEVQVETHVCPEGVGPDIAEDRQALLVMQSLAKKCPKCNMFVMKSGGCDYMMCGTAAHGNLYDAIRNGGCGHAFSWKTGKPVSTFFVNLEGKRVTGDAAAMYPDEIRALKAKLGISTASAFGHAPEVKDAEGDAGIDGSGDVVVAAAAAEGGGPTAGGVAAPALHPLPDASPGRPDSEAAAAVDLVEVQVEVGVAVALDGVPNSDPRARADAGADAGPGAGAGGGAGAGAGGAGAGTAGSERE